MAAWFFTQEEIVNQKYKISDENVKHIRVLRMKRGEALTLVTPKGIQHECTITDVNQDHVEVDVVSSSPCQNEPDVFVTLYQALPKGDKMDYIVQKCVELGVSRIVPMVTARCVSRPDEKSLKKKISRWQKIAFQAAMQSRRGIIPEVCRCISLKQAADRTAENEKTVFFYELGGKSVKEILAEKPKTIGMFIGSEGGFEASEAELITSNGAVAATLGRRILRAETAPLAALSVIMYQTDNFS